MARPRRRRLYRHRMHGDHQGSRQRLGQCRHLSGLGARRQDAQRFHRARQARRHHPQEMVGARRALPDGDHGRPGAGAGRRGGLDPCPSTCREFDTAGGRIGRAIKVVKGRVTGLPFPADAELVFEGFMPPPEELSMIEGPFGEWPGYYASSGPEPVLQVKAIYHRNDPIQVAQPPAKPTYPGTYFGTAGSALLRAARCGTRSKPPACRASKASGRCRAAARASSTSSRSSRCMPATPRWPAWWRPAAARAPIWGASSSSSTTISTSPIRPR